MTLCLIVKIGITLPLVRTVVPNNCSEIFPIIAQMRRTSRKRRRENRKENVGIVCDHF